MSYDVDIGKCSHNYTYNTSKFFHTHIELRGGETGIQALHGLNGEEAAAVLRHALKSIWREYADINASGMSKKYDAENGWGSAFGSVLFLSEILADCLENPEEIVRVS